MLCYLFVGFLCWAVSHSPGAAAYHMILWVISKMIVYHCSYIYIYICVHVIYIYIYIHIYYNNDSIMLGCVIRLQ